jgi:hypothetical protein
VVLTDPLVATIQVGEGDRFLDHPADSDIGSCIDDRSSDRRGRVAAQRVVRLPSRTQRRRGPSRDVRRQVSDGVVTSDCKTHRGAIEQIGLHGRGSRGSHTIRLRIGSHHGRHVVPGVDEGRNDSTSEHPGCSGDEHSLAHGSTS